MDFILFYFSLADLYSVYSFLGKEEMRKKGKREKGKKEKRKRGKKEKGKKGKEEILSRLGGEEQ